MAIHETPQGTTPDLDQLRRQAKELLRAHSAGDTQARQRVARALPKLAGTSWDRTAGFRARLTDAQLVIARERGFDSWPKLKAYADTGEGGLPPFRRAVLAVVDGDIQTLRALLQADPQLITERSPERHRAQLLHYVAVNGVENELQRTPPNAVEICRLLLDAGAEVDSPCETYGGGPNQTTMNLLVSSAHPHLAGLQSVLVEALIDGGAAIDGPRGDNAPLRTALQFGYPEAAETLTRRGASVDALDLAAGLGRTDLMAVLLENGANSAAPEGSGPNDNGPKSAQDWRPSAQGGHFDAFVLACRNGRTESAGYLLERGVDIDALSDGGGTGLHEAILWNRHEVVHLLLERGADAAILHGRWQATALDFASYNGRTECVKLLLANGASDLDEALVSAAGQGHLEIAQLLLAAGADPVSARDRALKGNDETMVALLRGAQM